MSKYTERVNRSLEGLSAVSVGPCNGCPICLTDYGADDLESGVACDEGSFSWAPCGICDGRLGGTRYTWHWATPEGINHATDACVDCLFYLANGEEPNE